MTVWYDAAFFGAISAALGTCAYLPYIRDTLQGRTQPQRASWLIWSVLCVIAFFVQLHEGATHSLWFAGAMVSGTLSVFLLSLRYGTGGLLCRRDCTVLALAAGGLAAWYITETAAFALMITISISFLGGVITVAKAYKTPHTETFSKWFTSLGASVFALLSVQTYDPLLLAYPMYLLVLNSSIVTALALGALRDRQIIPAE
ncbi:MAG: hypothetical protein AB8B71_04895 [Paracoccaceae bacterium]